MLHASIMSIVEAFLFPISILTTYGSAISMYPPRGFCMLLYLMIEYMINCFIRDIIHISFLFTVFWMEMF